VLFEVHGPFEVPSSADQGVDQEGLKEFWRGVEQAVTGLPDAIGCYIAAVKRKGRSRPIYVGKTVRAGFARECFTPHKREIFRFALDQTKGSLLLFLLPKCTPGGRFCRSATGNTRDIDFLEAHLIGLSLSRNPDLLNRRDTRIFRELTVPGILNTGRGKPSSSVSALRRTLGLARDRRADSPRRKDERADGVPGPDDNAQDSCAP